MYYSFQAKDEAVGVLKMALQEKNFSGDTPSKSSSPETEKLVKLLEDRIKEKEQIITSLQTELQEKNNMVKLLKDETNGLKDDWGIREKELVNNLTRLESQLTEILKKHDVDMREKDQLIKEKETALNESLNNATKLQTSIDNKEREGQKSSNERLLLLDAEKERQFSEEKQIFKERVEELQAELMRVAAERDDLKRAIDLPAKELQEELNRLTEEREKLSKDLEKARQDVEIRNKEAKDATAKMLKAKGQMKSKINNFEKQNERLVKELETIRKVCYCTRDLFIHCSH